MRNNYAFYLHAAAYKSDIKGTYNGLFFGLGTEFSHAHLVGNDDHRACEHPRYGVNLHQVVEALIDGHDGKHPHHAQDAGAKHGHNGRQHRFPHATKCRSRYLITACNKLEQQHTLHSHRAVSDDFGVEREETEEKVALPCEKCIGKEAPNESHS